MLRVKAKQPAYWKAENLDVFDGARWRESQSGTREAIDLELPANPAVPRALHPARSRSTSATCARARSSPPASRRRRRTCRGRAAIPNAPPGIWTVEPHAAPRRHLHGRASTRRGRPRTSCAAAGRLLRPRLRRLPDARRSPTASSRRRRRADRPGPASRRTSRRGPRAASRRRHPPQRRRRRRSQHVDGQQALARSQPQAHVGALPAAGAAAPRPGRLRQRGRGLPRRRRLHLHRDAAADGAHARGLPVRRQDRLLPAVLGRDGAAAADGRHPRARGDRLHLRLATTAGRRSTSCATSTRTRGSRPGSRLRLGHVRPDARRPRRRARRAATRAARLRAATCRDLGGGGALDPRAGAAARPSGPPWALDVGGGVLAALLLAGGCVRGRCSVAAAAPAPLLELERALRRTRAARRTRARRCRRSRRSFARSPAAPGYVRALREQRYGGRGGAPTRAQRRGLRERAGARRRPARAPARVVGAAAEASRDRAPKLDRAWMTSTTSSSAGRRCSRPATSTPATVPLAKARDLEPEKTSIREALGRAYFRSAPVRGGARRVRGGRRARADQRLRAVLPRSLAARAGPSEGRAQGRSRWPPDCVRTAATTASTETAHAPPHRRSGAISNPRSFRLTA